MTLQNKIALITGAKGGLGTDVTHAFLDAGATVIGVSRSIQDADFAHPNFAAMPAELSNGDAARTLAAAVVARFGRIDALVHLVGAWGGGQRVEDTDAALWTKMIELNLLSAVHIAGAVIPQMRQQGAGRILTVGSRSALEHPAMSVAYNAAKAALISFTQTIATENADRGITANVVVPGTMDTPANRKADPGADFSKWVPPAEVAAMLVHLASDSASRINCAVIPIYL